MKLYNDHLWDILSPYYERAGDIVKNVNKFVPQRFRNLFILRTREFLGKKKDYFKGWIESYYSLTTYESVKGTPFRSQEREHHLKNIDTEIEKTITVEVFEYLLSKTGRNCLNELILLSLPTVLAIFNKRGVPDPKKE